MQNSLVVVDSTVTVKLQFEPMDANGEEAIQV